MTGLEDGKEKVLQKPENLSNKDSIAPESISSTENFPEVYETIASSAKIRAKPTIDSLIILEMPLEEKSVQLGRTTTG